jgi:hypothetical protein
MVIPQVCFGFSKARNIYRKAAKNAKKMGVEEIGK